MNSTAKSIMIFPSESFSRTEDSIQNRTQDRPKPKDAQGNGVYNFGNENASFYT